MGVRRANRKEILTAGDGGATDHLYTAGTVHRAFSGHFDKHSGAGRKNWYCGSEVHPFFRMDNHGRAY